MPVEAKNEQLTKGVLAKLALFATPGLLLIGGVLIQELWRGAEERERERFAEIIGTIEAQSSQINTIEDRLATIEVNTTADRRDLASLSRQVDIRFQGIADLYSTRDVVQDQRLQSLENTLTEINIRLEAIENSLGGEDVR